MKGMLSWWKEKGKDVQLWERNMGIWLRKGHKPSSSSSFPYPIIVSVLISSHFLHSSRSPPNHSHYSIQTPRFILLKCSWGLYSYYLVWKGEEMSNYTCYVGSKGRSISSTESWNSVYFHTEALSKVIAYQFLKLFHFYSFKPWMRRSWEVKWLLQDYIASIIVTPKYKDQWPFSLNYVASLIIKLNSTLESKNDITSG